MDSGPRLADEQGVANQDLVMPEPITMLELQPTPNKCCADGAHFAMPRRRFLRLGVALGASVTSIFGGFVGFAPSAAASHLCTATPPQSTSCGNNFRACFGPCLSSGSSCCTYADGSGFRRCCGCSFFCSPAQVVVYSSGKTCYFCCRYC